MSNCCCPAPVDTEETRSVCPASGTVGAPVELITVKALLTEPALSRLSAIDHRFCPDPVCDVVYFNALGDCYRRQDLRVPVWQKEPFGARLVCYCFGETEGTIREEIETAEASRAVERVREHIAAKRCACDVRNPRGACCLGDLMAAVTRVEQAALARAGIAG
jgi:hypothetical protein